DAQLSRSQSLACRARMRLRTRKLRVRCATFAFAISFLLGMHAILGQEPPIQRRSTTAVLCPDCAKCQAMSLPPTPLPRTRTSNCSGLGIRFSPWCEVHYAEILVSLWRRSAGNFRQSSLFRVNSGALVGHGPQLPKHREA